MYTDTHCHLDLADVDTSDLIERARAEGVRTLVTVGVDLATSVQAFGTATSNHDVWAVIGIHPNNAIEATDGVLRCLRDLARSPRVVGLGETGLDLYREGAPPVRQEESFREHIRMAKEMDKALVVHDRDAHDDVVRVLLDERPPERTVFHCFSGDVALAQTCAEHGWYVSFAGTLTFRNAPELREAAAVVPRELLVVETDTPYLSPHPFRGQPNEPARVVHTCAALAAVHGVESEEMAAITTENARRLFKI